MGKFVYQVFMTPDPEEGGYTVEFPDLPGCVTEGDTYMEAVEMAADAGRTFVASMLLHGEEPPAAAPHAAPEGCEAVYVFFETDESYIVRGDVVSAAQAARELGVSAGRVSHMLAAGVLDGYRRGRSTFVTTESIERRKADGARPGRPRKALEA